MKKFMYRFGIVGLGLLFVSLVVWVGSFLLQEGFDNFGILVGWSVVNFSDNLVSEGWFCFFSLVDIFSVQVGVVESYIVISVFIGVVDVNGNLIGCIDIMLVMLVILLVDLMVLNFLICMLIGNFYGEILYVGVIVVGLFVELMMINLSFVVGSYFEQWIQYIVILFGQGDGIFGCYYFEYQIFDVKVVGNFIGLDLVIVSVVFEFGIVVLLLGGGVLLVVWCCCLFCV